MTTTKRKSRSNSKPSTPRLNIAVMLNGMDDFRPTTDTAFDIETGPLSADDTENLLSAESARVAAIGYYQPTEGRYFIAYDDDEAAMLQQFWGAFLSLQGAGSKFLGFNIFGFDLPFLMRRSWFHGIRLPMTLMTFNGRYFADTFVDLMSVWKCGEWKTFISLDNLARFLDVGGKVGSGEKFWSLWDADREAAIEYLNNDVKLVIDCAARMGFTNPPAA